MPSSGLRYICNPPGAKVTIHQHLDIGQGGLRLACLPLCEKPNRSVHVQVGTRRPHQQGVGIANKAWQRRDPEPLPYSSDLRLRVRDPERNPRGANLTLAGPVWNSMNAYDDPPDGIERARTPPGRAQWLRTGLTPG